MVVNNIPQRLNLTSQTYPKLIAVMGGIILAGSSVYYWVYPHRALTVQFGLSLGVILLLVAVLLKPGTIYVVFTGHSENTTDALVMCLAFAGILLVINFLSVRYNYEFDLTETGEFTLSHKTIEVLQGLAEPVQVIGFFRVGDQRYAKAKIYLERYIRYSNLLTYKLYDPTDDIALVKEYKVDSYGLLFVNGSRRYSTPDVNEATITTGLMCVTTHLNHTSQQPLISVDPKYPPNRILELTPFQMTFTLVTIVILLPVLALIAGARMWWTRR